MVTHDMTEITEAEEGALPGQVVFSTYDIWSMPSPTTNIFPLLTLLFIRGLSCPSCIQASISLNCLKPNYLDFLTAVFLNLVVTLAF